MDENVIIQIDDAQCTLPEAMLAILAEQNKYKEILGDDGWDTEIGETTVGQYVMDNVKKELSIIYALCAMAEDEDIELTTDESAEAETEAAEYYASLNASEIAYTGAEESDAVSLYKAYALARKVYDAVVDENMTVEISDEQARVIEIQYIYDTDSASIESVYKRAQEDTQDFLLLAEMCSQSDSVECTLKRGESSETFESVAFSLSTGEISEVFEDGDGYYIIKCVDSYIEDKTSENKAALIAGAEYECVSEIYGEFLDTASNQFNDSVWEDIEFID